MCLFLIVTTLFAANASFANRSVAASTVNMTATTNKASYYIREPVNLGGTILEGSQNATDYLAGVEIDDRRGSPLLFRTVSIGNPAPAPPFRWTVQISAIYITDSFGTQTNSIAIKPMQTLNLHVTVHNNNTLAYENAVAAATIFDGNLIPIIAVSSALTVPPGSDATASWSVPVPEWAYSGKALAVASLYGSWVSNDWKLPVDGGFPIAPEAEHVFYLTRNSLIQTPYSVLPTTDIESPGRYQIAFKMPPDSYTQPGTYTVYTAAVSPAKPYLSSNASTLFSLTQYQSPPQAAFTYAPLQAYGGMPITFDASSSSAEGYNDTITRYEWTINDSPPVHVIKAGNFTNPPDPTLLHTFASSGTYVAQLNVTDNEGLWSTTSKPVIILPDYGPVANFTLTPTTPVVNRIVTFDASSSQPGWSSQIPGLAPIASYSWNFGDGNNTTTSNSTIQHFFTQVNNYSVGLTVTDSLSRTSLISKTVQVTNRTAWDLDGNGIINMRDIAIAAKAFNTVPGDLLWNPIADITGPTPLVPDGIVNMRDVSLIAKHFGEQA